MGYYINPTDMSKEQWLAGNGFKISGRDIKMNGFENIRSNELPVCLVDNGPFTAAAIAYNQQEFDEFMKPDGRGKTWYLVPRVLLKQWYEDASSENH